MFDRQNFFDKPVKNDMRTYKTTYDYTTACLLDYPYFKEHKLVAIDISK